MEPISPVIVGLEPYELALGADQSQYAPLPVLRGAAPQFPVMSRWTLSPVERALVAEGADVYLTLWTFGMPYPPTRVEIMRATADADLIIERMGLNEELNMRLDAAAERAEAAEAKTEANEGEADGEQ